MVDSEVTVLINRITEQLRSHVHSIIKAHIVRSVHGTALDMRFFLRHSRLEGECHLRVILERENVFHLK